MERRYEGMLIIRSDLKDEELEGVFNKINERIKQLGGEVFTARIWARERPFAYRMRLRGAERKWVDKGCYWLVEFGLDTQTLRALKETIRLEENIIRSLIIKRERRNRW